MCTISFTPEELNVLVSAVHDLCSFYDYRLLMLDPVDYGSAIEDLYRSKLKVAMALIEKLNDDLPF